MNVSGWGHYPTIEAESRRLTGVNDIAQHIAGFYTSRGAKGDIIPRGLGRAYGDSALATNLASTQSLDHFLDFNPGTGALNCESGITFDDLLTTFVPQGWFPPVTPATRFTTIGGAIAADVQGWNHRTDGSFCDHVTSIKLIDARGDIVECSRTTLPELFHATCGGLGLTGVIISASLALRRIASDRIRSFTVKARNLAETLELFSAYQNASYSGAWLDCHATGETLGRSLVTFAEHVDQGVLTVPKAHGGRTSRLLPLVDRARWSVRAFNALRFGLAMRKRTDRVRHYQPFFYPLDRFSNASTIHGPGGYVQYQFVMPRAAGLEGMTAMIKRIAQSGRATSLSVLKTMGRPNQSVLAFPTEGYSLSIDFRLHRNLFDLLDDLDLVVLDHGGRVSVAKDARMSERAFRNSYPRWEELRKLREASGADRVFNSLQSRRLGL